MRDSDRFAARLIGKATDEQMRLIMKAYRFAKEAHRGQLRDGGGRYFEHPKAVALILMDEMKIMDKDMIIACLLPIPMAAQTLTA